MSGYLSVRVGPMFSGKTTWINKELTKSIDVNFKKKKIAKIIHDCDVRMDVASNDASGTTHNSSYKNLNPKIEIIRCTTLSSITNIEDYHCIGIDEAQFFPDLADKVIKWLDNNNLTIFVSSLDGDFNRNNFGNVHKILPHADEFRKISAVCKECILEIASEDFHGSMPKPNAAIFTKKKILNGDQIDVGGSDKYSPVCRKHYSR